ncbi:hypothetical protein SARC_14971, partial [Sphaeroforma arctica JP610]
MYGPQERDLPSKKPVGYIRLDYKGPYGTPKGQDRPPPRVPGRDPPPSPRDVPLNPLKISIPHSFKEWGSER